METYEKSIADNVREACKIIADEFRKRTGIKVKDVSASMLMPSKVNGTDKQDNVRQFCVTLTY